MREAQAIQTSTEGTTGAAPAKKRGWFRRHGLTVILVLIMLAGVGLLLYPSISNWWNQMHQSRVVMDYAAAVSDGDEAKYKEMFKEARAYNKRLAQTGPQWQMSKAQEAEYDSLLNIDGSGVMGYISIPKINVELPVYHGTDDAVLQTSIGHLSGSSLPIGGKSTHSVLSGHRGLPSARLFTDLDRLVEGDTFTITVLNRTITYQVDQIRIVEPNDLSDLQIEKGKDLCTLVTCTPYGINTQRLLVRGHRIPNANGDAQVIAEALQIRPMYIALFVTVPAMIVLVVYVFFSTRRRRREYDFEGEHLRSLGLSRPKAGFDDERTQSFIVALRDYWKKR